MTLSGNGGLKLNLAGAFGDEEILRFKDVLDFPDDHPIKPIKGVVALDFDGTITLENIWKILSRGQNPTWANGAVDLGTSDQSKEVRSELGQFARLQELNKNGAGFSTGAVSGGRKERIEELIELLKYLQGKKIVVMVISKGNVAVIRQILNDTGLLYPFIAKTYGYKAWQHEAEDNDRRADAEHAKLKGDVFMTYKGGYDHEGGKKGIILHFMEEFHKKFNLDKNRAILVDDSKDEIKEIDEYLKKPDCFGKIETLKVSDRAGMSSEDMENLKRMVEGWN